MSHDIHKILQEAKIIAVIGCSINPGKAAHKVPAFLQKNGYRIIPINPAHDEILGETCYPDLKSIPDRTNIDIVDIFRPSSETTGIVRRIIEWSNQKNQRPVIWTQLSVSSEKAAKLARDAGFVYVKNHCMKIELQRLLSQIQS